MTRQIINVGVADKGNGDPIRTAFIKANANFAELYNILSNNTGGSIITTDVIGSVFADDSTLLVDGINGSIPYSVLSGAPTIPAAQVQSNWTAASGMGVILNKPTLFSGSYTDLTNKPTIPTLVSQLANDSGFLTSVGNISNIQSEGNINIEVNLTDSTKRIWQFGEDGDLRFPDGTNQTGKSVTVPIDQVFNFNLSFTNPFESTRQITIDQYGLITDNTIWQFQTADSKTWYLNSDQQKIESSESTGCIKFGTATKDNTGAFTDIELFSFGTGNGTNAVYISAGSSPTNNRWKFGGDGALTIPGDIRSEGNINIDINLSDSTLRRWQFGEDGELTFPDGYLKIVPNGANPYISNRTDNGLGLVSGSAIQIRQSTADAYGITINSSTTDTSLGGGAELSSGSNIDVNGSKIILGQYTTNYLDANNGLTGQLGIEINNNDKILIGQKVSTLVDGVTISAFSGWTFDPATLSGPKLIFPDDTVQTTAWTGIANALRSEGNINIDINLSDSTLRRWQFGEDGILTLPSTGKISNSGYDWTFGTDGKLTAPGNLQVNGGKIILNTGGNAYVESVDYGVNSANSAVNIFGGPYQKIKLRAGFGTEATWTFGTDGTLTFPDNTVQTTAAKPFSFSVAADDSTQRAISNNESIKFTGAGGVTTSSDAEGNITITGSKVIGSWTVTNGTSTYSFTVPMDGTYVMWVKGNIPNGIITWNATLSISNINVPAIGTQYAWNYTGGGSPILLTAIPNQIKGSAGTISTDNTYAGTTSNIFDFGISNTSGANQTVYYGYTKIS